MQFGIIVLTLAAYGLAGWLYWRDRTANYLFALVAGHLFSLPSPLWQAAYQFSYDPSFARLYTVLGRPLPLIIFIAAWTIMLPPLVVFYLQRNNWWFPGYATALVTFAVFALYYLLIETIGLRAGWWSYQRGLSLPLGASLPLITALINGLIGLGSLSVLILTRRYAWLSLLMVLVPVPLLLGFFVKGVLGAPLYTALLLRNSPLLGGVPFAETIGTIGTLGLLFWAVHIVASVIAGQRLSRVPARG